MQNGRKSIIKGETIILLFFDSLCYFHNSPESSRLSRHGLMPLLRKQYGVPIRLMHSLMEAVTLLK